jgi:hypothetical protein
MEKVAALTAITQRQEHLIAALNHALHGKRLEKLTEDERQLAFADLSIALAEVEVQKKHLAAKTGDNPTTKPVPNRKIADLPAALPRIEEVIEPDSLICPCSCGIVHKIGENCSERLDVVPAPLRVIITVRTKIRLQDLHRRRDRGSRTIASDHECNYRPRPPPPICWSISMKTTCHYTDRARFWHGQVLICTVLCWRTGSAKRPPISSPSSAR